VGLERDEIEVLKLNYLEIEVVEQGVFKQEELER
jgi:hypothetical protein